MPAQVTKPSNHTLQNSLRCVRCGRIECSRIQASSRCKVPESHCKLQKRGAKFSTLSARPVFPPWCRVATTFFCCEKITTYETLRLHFTPWESVPWALVKSYLATRLDAIPFDLGPLSECKRICRHCRSSTSFTPTEEWATLNRQCFSWFLFLWAE